MIDQLEKWIENAGPETAEASKWFGYFITFYADIEGQCHIMFRRYCGTSEKTARIIVGGRPLSDIVRILKAVVPESDMPDHGKEDFEVCMLQFHHLTEFRHQLVHRGFQRANGLIAAEMGLFKSSNLLTAKKREDAKIASFYIEDMKAAAKDCLRIHTRMQFMAIPNMANRQLLAKEYEEAVYGPWYFKPVATEGLPAMRFPSS